VGLVRRHNEDSFLAQFPVFLVADGMGGHAAGEVASGITSEQFRSLALAESLTVEEVAETIDEANRTVLGAARDADRLHGMGTTLVGLIRVDDRSQELWLVFNIGDSRLYRWFEGAMTQVTTDHSEVQELVELGAVTGEGARHHPLRNVITRAVGTESSVEPDFWLLPPAPGERFLLCSDGLTSELPDAAIAEVLSHEPDPSVAANRLVERAVAAGGHDNVTVVVVDVLVDGAEGVEDTARGVGDTTQGVDPPPGTDGQQVDPPPPPPPPSPDAKPSGSSRRSRNRAKPKSAPPEQAADLIVSVPRSSGAPSATSPSDGEPQELIEAVPETDDALEASTTKRPDNGD
jgi:protein phosphatase